MSEQPGGRRLFVAVWPAEDLVRELEGLERPQARGLRWTTRDQWHVTLRFLGSVEEGQVATLTVRLGEAAASGGFERPVMASAGPEPQALGRGVWMLPVAGLEELAAAVGDAVDGAGLGEGAGLREAPGAALGEAPGAALGERAGRGAGGSAEGRAGERAGGRAGRFTGHLTLARAKRPSLLRDLPKPPLGSSWEVQEVTLVNSTLHPAGARYDIVDRWGL